MLSRSLTLPSSIDAFTSRTAFSRCDSFTFSQSSCSLLRIDALLGHGAQALLHAVLDLALDERFGHREVVRVHQFVHHLVLGLLLRLVLALGEDGLADGFAEFVHGAVVAQFLGELVVRLPAVPCGAVP